MNAKENSTVCLTGSYSTGKSTQLDRIERVYGDKFHYVRDAGRHLLNEFGKTPEEMNEVEKSEMQILVAEYYLKEESIGRFSGKRVIMDASLIEAVAYAKDLVRKNIYDNLNNILGQKSKNYTAIHFPTDIDLEKDGVRHSNDEYRIQIDQTIRALIDEHRIKTIYITSTDFDVRSGLVDLILNT